MSHRRRIIAEDPSWGGVREALALVRGGDALRVLSRDAIGQLLVRLRRPSCSFLLAPAIVNVEITNLCNLACCFCATGLQRTGRPKGKMAAQVFRRIVDELPGSTQLLLAGFGEPFMHEGLEEFMELVATAGKSARMDLYTNLGVAPEERMRRLCGQPFRSLIVSLDAITRETYLALKGRDEFDQVWENLRIIADERRRRRARHAVVVQMVVTRRNDHERQAFIEAIRRLQLIPRLKRLNTHSAELTEAVATDLEVPGLTRYAQRGYSRRCDWVWGGLQCYWNGDVSVCCQDPLGRHIYGNVGQMSLRELLNTAPARCEFRRQYFADPGRIAICRRCDVA